MYGVTGLVPFNESMPLEDVASALEDTIGPQQ